ncbi:hypothetical protein [Methylobacterium dankookense]|uniref:Uncharacterized protein n=1 Tax=Methylobacterium dankookense TaxID=560405 RepID=A0A564G5M5_9HYPH|nr:hypothetical protein [Methylobacterium dankookense]GJD59267.1 hypothetical protein IFDJLNFL_5195 [Methylobacterium dankookense]VUF15617.1 hypothetical protein MTDSW087_05361 [Methylobacterium dankookense]
MILPAPDASAQFVSGFVDCLFLALTTAIAFSLTDKPPLTAHFKLLMMAEALISLLTVALVVTRPANIFA